MINRFEIIDGKTFEAKDFKHIPVDHRIDDRDIFETVIVTYYLKEDNTVVNKETKSES